MPRRTSSSLSALAAVALLATGPLATSASAEPTSSANPLDQTVGANERTSTQKVLFNSGHMDMGPRMVNGKWQLQIRDDSGKTPVWRDMDKTVLTVKDETQLKVPSDKKYAFIKEKPGSPVWVLPQTEKPGMPWPGWNTQHPSALKVMNKGVNFTLDRVSGPGSVMMYLENGTLEGPQLLWDSHKSERQNIFAEANTHTHANWVFTKPGIYFMQVTASATGRDGKVVKDTEILRFAVGSETDPMDGFSDAPFSKDAQDEKKQAGSILDGPWPWVAAAALALVVFGSVFAGSRRRQQAVRDGQSAHASDNGSSRA